jgi:sugar phosphate isomerase/epimerase
MPPAEIRTILDDLGLVAGSTHGPFPAKDNLNEIVDAAKTLGYTRHISGFGPPDFETAEKCVETAAKAQAAAGLLKGTGITFGLHNHWWEFDHRIDGKMPHQIMMDNAPDVFAEVDTYWVQVGGEDAAEVVKALGPRAPLLHIKDGPAVRDKAMTAVGAGTMDWKAVIGAADDSTEWLVVELDSCDTDMTEAVRASLRYLVESGLGRGMEPAPGVQSGIGGAGRKLPGAGPHTFMVRPAGAKAAKPKGAAKLKKAAKPKKSARGKKTGGGRKCQRKKPK